MIRCNRTNGAAGRTARAASPWPSRARLLGICLCGATLVGCGARGPDRYELSGKILNNGQPLPAGYIVFSPDTSRGQSGPGSQADIKAGEYHVAANQGVLGGPYVATIYGFDGQKIVVDHLVNPLGKPLFLGHRVAIDLPRQASVKDFDLHDVPSPGTAARK